jgi:hypothetical protein
MPPVPGVSFQPLGAVHLTPAGRDASPIPISDVAAGDASFGTRRTSIGS